MSQSWEPRRLPDAVVPASPLGPSETVLPEVVHRAPRLVHVGWWRLLVAASALAGAALSLRGYEVAPQGLGQVASWAVGGLYVVLAALAWLEPRWSWGLLRGGSAVLMLLVAVGYLVLEQGDGAWWWSQPWTMSELGDNAWSFLVHVVTPALVVVDYVLWCSGPFRAWHPFAWLAVPAAYLSYYRWADLDLYDVLRRPGPEPTVTTAAFMAALLGGGFVVMALASSRASSSSLRLR